MLRRPVSRCLGRRIIISSLYYVIILYYIIMLYVSVSRAPDYHIIIILCYYIIPYYHGICVGVSGAGLSCRVLLRAACRCAGVSALDSLTRGFTGIVVHSAARRGGVVHAQGRVRLIE